MFRRLINQLITLHTNSLAYVNQFILYLLQLAYTVYSHYAKLLLRCTINVLLKFIILYFNNYLLPRPENLYVILARHNEIPEDDILNVETCRSMLFVIIVFDIIVQSLVKL